MTRIICFLLMLFTFGQTVMSQKSDADSLKRLLDIRTGEEKVSLYLDLAEHYLYNLNDSALYFAKEAFKSAEELKMRDRIADAYALMGEIHLDNYSHQESLQNLQLARDIYKQLDEMEKLAEVTTNISVNYYFQNRYDEALKFIEESRKIAQDIKSKELLASALLIRGRILNRADMGEDAIASYEEALELYEELDDKKEIASVLNSMGSYYSSRSDFTNAIRYYEKTLEIRREQDDPRAEGIVLNNLGNQHLQLGNFDKAIEYYREASDIFKEIHFDRGTAATLTGLAVIYENLRQYESVLDVYNEVLEIRRKQDDKFELANTLSNIAVTYSKMLNDSLETLYGVNYQDSVYNQGLKPDLEYGEQSVNYNLQALALRREINDPRGISITLANLGHVYQSMGDFDMASQYFSEYLELPKEFQDDDTRISIMIGMGKLAMYEKDYNKAIVYFNNAYRSATGINKKIHIREAARTLSDLYERTGNYQLALDYFQRFHNVYDSLNQENTREQIHEMQVKYAAEATEKENELLRKDQLIKDTQLKNSRYALIASIIVLLIFAGLVIQLIRQNNLRKKANEELERKNMLITEQTKEITDSIQYASRIQNAVLPPDEYMKKHLPEQFILYKPRDIVSGDYYWITEKNERIITVVADCTGHGVPGAFMSMLGVAFLNEIVSKHESLSTDLILNELRKQVIVSLHQTGREGESQDGMDISVYILDKKSNRLEFSGANNSLLIYRDEEMIELKADKMPIGIHAHAGEPFSRKEFQLKKGDMIYAFTDGFPDQFGGPQGKKFMIRNFKKLLGQIHKQDPHEQKILLEKTLRKWMADFNQVDDILVMGVRV